MDSNHLITSAHSIQSMRELQDLVEKIDYGLTADKMREVYNKHCNDLKYLLIMDSVPGAMHHGAHRIPCMDIVYSWPIMNIMNILTSVKLLIR